MEPFAARASCPRVSRGPSQIQSALCDDTARCQGAEECVISCLRSVYFGDLEKGLEPSQPTAGLETRELTTDPCSKAHDWCPISAGQGCANGSQATLKTWSVRSGPSTKVALATFFQVAGQELQL